jgi:hypothetical protein
VELFDLSRDPWEQKDVAADKANASVLADLRARLRKHMEETRDPLLDGPVAAPMHHRSLAWLRG